jgi:hypothetical protein
MFHCHVEDHMEAGMMVVYTIYKPQSRPCPVEIVEGDLWKNPEKLSLTVKNASTRPIRQVAIISEILMAPQDLRRPFNSGWTSKAPIAPKEEQAIEQPGIPAASAQKILGWVFFPASVKYQDGTEWLPTNEGECFKVIWRDPDHPDLPALPPRQFEINSD